MSPARASFPPANRLRVKADFDRVFARPNQRCSQGPLQAIFKAAPDDTDECHGQYPRLGLIVAKRFLPLAVQRNRVKRLTREAFRACKHDLPAVDIIVRLIKKPGAELTAEDLKALFGKISTAK